MSVYAFHNTEQLLATGIIIMFTSGSGRVTNPSQLVSKMVTFTATNNGSLDLTNLNQSDDNKMCLSVKLIEKKINLIIKAADTISRLLLLVIEP